MVVYKAKFLYDGQVSGGHNGAIYDSTDSGWFDGQTFKQFFKEFFFLNLNGDGPLALIDDKLGSNFSEEVIEL